VLGVSDDCDVLNDRHSPFTGGQITSDLGAQGCPVICIADCVELLVRFQIEDRYAEDMGDEQEWKKITIL